MRFLYNAPAILHKKALIVGDTHFGMERKLRARGIHDEQFSMRLLMRLLELVKSHKAERVIFLGDVKDDITMLDRKSEEVLERLSKACRIMIVRGNHDGGIEGFKGAQIHPSDGFVFGNLGLLHGHSWPADELMRCSHLVMGHQHPLASFTDKMGKRHSEPVWMIAQPNVDRIAERYDDFNRKIKLILMPAFNPLIGFPINSTRKEQLGPILNNNLFKLDHALLFRLDGTCLGELNSIKKGGS